MEANPDVDLVWTRAKCYSQSKKTFLYELGEKALDFEDLLQKNRIPTLTVVFRRSAIEGIQDALGGRNWQMADYPLWLYISLGGRIHFLDEVTSVYRYLDESASHSKSYETAKKFQESAYEIRLYFSKYSKKENICQIFCRDPDLGVADVRLWCFGGQFEYDVRCQRATQGRNRACCRAVKRAGGFCIVSKICRQPRAAYYGV